MKAKDFISKYRNENFNCVYRLLSSKGVVVYVGSSSYPSNRISSHVSSDKEFDSVDFDVINGWCGMRDEESRQIVKHNPIYNTVVNLQEEFPKLKHAQDSMHKEIKALFRDLPCVFSRGRDKHVLAGDVAKLKADILKAAMKSLNEIHNGES